MKNIKGFTFVESIISLGILGIIVAPIMSLFVLAARINCDSNNYYNTMLTAQMHMEEIMAMENIDIDNYTYNHENGWFERNINQSVNDYGAVVRIIPRRNLLYSIEITILDDGEIIDYVKGSKIIIR
jgi:prepilin-type N-terminal cleavage/methylation domain-containing protein